MVIGECERRDCRCLAQSIHPALCLCSTDTPRSLDSVGGSVPVKSNNSVSDGLLASTRLSRTPETPGKLLGKCKETRKTRRSCAAPWKRPFFFLSPHSCWHFFQMSNRSPGTSYTRPSGRTLGECQERDRESPRKAADKVQRPLASLSAGRRGKETSRFSDDSVTLHLAIVSNLGLCSVS